MTDVFCGKCGNIITPKMLERKVPISDHDFSHNSKRDRTYNCCGRTWLLSISDDGFTRSVDYGPAIEEGEIYE